MEDNYIYSNSGHSSRSRIGMVCQAPTEDGILVDHLPEFLDNDAMDHSVPHVHTFFEIIWFQEEGGTHTVDFTEYPIQKDSLFLIHPGQVHHFDGVTRSRGITVKFCPDLVLMERGSQEDHILWSQREGPWEAPCLWLSRSEAEDIEGLIQSLEEELSHDLAYGHRDLLRSLLQILLIRIWRHHSDKVWREMPGESSSRQLYLEFLRLLEKEYRHLHSVKDYARILGVSQRTLSNATRECAGKSPLSIITGRIILEAKRLLRFTRLMVKEITYEMGYEDPSYFVKLFKRETGLLPQEFRSLDGGKTHPADMRIAIAVSMEEEVALTLSQTRKLVIMHLSRERKVMAMEEMDCGQNGPCLAGEIAALLRKAKAGILLSGNSLTEKDAELLKDQGIRTISGFSGNVWNAVKVWSRNSSDCKGGGGKP